MKLLEESFTLPPDSSVVDGNGVGYPLYVTAKRYGKELSNSVAAEGDLDTVTLLVLHSTSFHKEAWEPTLEALFELAFAGRQVKIREVWAIDCPNHGHAGVLNREVLKREPYATNFGCDGYVAAIHRFLMSAPNAFHVDFGKRRLVGLGHSLGANALLLLQGAQPVFPFISLIIVEPMATPGNDRHLRKLRARLVEGAKRRVFEWPDRETAFRSLRSNSQTVKWDERVLKAFVKHAIWETQTGTVRLACTPQQEQVMYLDAPGATKPVEELTRLCSILPVHLIIGIIKDFVPRIVHDELLDPSSGRTYASVKEVSEVGHLIPQEIPKKLGALVYEILRSDKERFAKL